MDWLLHHVEPVAQKLFTGGWNVWDLAWPGIFILMATEEMGSPAPSATAWCWGAISLTGSR
jgi:hypothetical protein